MGVIWGPKRTDTLILVFSLFRIDLPCFLNKKFSVVM